MLRGFVLFYFIKLSYRLDGEKEKNMANYVEKVNFCVGVYNGFDADDYIIGASSVEEAYSLAEYWGEVRIIIDPQGGVWEF